MKKILSLLLVALMIVGMLPMMPINASAADESYVKVTVAPADWSGNYLIVYEAGNLAFNGSLTTLDAVKNNTSVTITDGVIAATDEMKAISFTIEQSGTGYAIKSASNYYIGNTADSNKLNSSTSTKYTNTISLNSDGTVQIVGSGKSVLRYNATSGQERFRYFKSSTYTSQKAICLYKLTEAGEEAPCTHEQATVSEVAATCTVDGSKTVTCDCGYTETTAIPATGHSYVDGACSACGEAIPAAIATKITTAAEFTSGEYVMVVSSGYAMGNYDSSSGWVLPVQPVITGNDVNDAAGGIWTLTVTDSSVTIQDANDVYIAPKGGNTNGITTGEYSWNVTVNEDGSFTFAGNGEDTVYLASNTNTDNGKNKFRAYKTTTVNGDATTYLAKFDLYKIIDGEGCQHANTTTNTVAATCTTVGSETVVCNDCGKTISTTEIPMIDHDFVDGACSVCKISQEDWESTIDTPDMTPEQIVEAAYALESGASLEGTQTLTGVITEINAAYSSTYSNITVTMVVGDMTDKPIMCYRMKGDGADQIGLGDTITVTGTLMNYNGTIEFGSGCTLDSWENTNAEEEVVLSTPEEIVNAAYALEVGASLTKEYSLTGVITSVDNAYDSSYGNITVTMVVGDMTDKPIKCFRMKGDGADVIGVGDIITVTGTLKNYNGTVEFDSGCALTAYTDTCAEGHTEVVDAAVAATCTATGLTEGKHCSVCNEVTVAQEEVAALGHTGVNSCDGGECSLCGEYVMPVHPNNTYFAAVVPANCQETGHDEYWTCNDCGAYLGDAEGTSELNPAWIFYTGEHVRPEDAIVCAVVPCVLCGEDSYGEACDRGDAPVCQDAPCVNCGETVYGWGCNYNTGDEEVPLPLCQPGDCVYCGTHYEKLYDHENGSWAPCSVDGECSYGCGKQYPATGVHIAENPCEGGICQLCWEVNVEPSHNFVDGTCSNCGATDPNAEVYTVEFTGTIRNSANFVGAVELNQYSEIKFSDNLTQNYIFEHGGLLAFDGEVTEAEATIENCEKVTYGLKLSNGLYGGTTAGIPAAEYGKALSLRLFVELPNGEFVYGGIKTYSVKQYCEGRITSASSAQTMKNLAAATLHYGAMAQINFNKDTDQLANNGLTGAYDQTAFAYDASYIDALNTNASFAKAGTGTFAAPRRTLNFVGAVEIVHQYQPSGIANMEKIEMLVWKNVTGELNEADADVITMESAGSGWYKAATAGIPAAEYGYTFILCAKVTDADGNTYYSDLSFYSPETYAANQISKTSTSENTKNVCKAMVVFGQMAKIHFGK